MTAYHSPQHFVKALKASSDPPVAEGPLKIAIAEQAWHNNSFYLPNKAEVIAEFVLSKFSRDRADGTALGDDRYWRLLFEVLSSSSTDWVKPMLGRVSILPVVSAFLNVWDRLGSLEPAAYCISILFPLGTQKSTTEALLEVWGTYLQSFVDGVSAIKIGLILTKVYSDSLSNSSSRKKASSNFIQNSVFFGAWLERLTDCPQPLQQAILSSGVETIFNPETLRSLTESAESTPFFAALASGSRSTVLKVLPSLFESYCLSLKRYQGTASSGLSNAAMRFYDACTSLIGDRDAEAWNTVSALTEFVAKERLYEPESSVGRNITLALAGEISPAMVCCLSATTRVDYNLVLPAMNQLFSRLLAVGQTGPVYLTFLDLLLDYHTKTRTINVYIETLLTSLTLSSIPTIGPPEERYATIHSSPVLHPQHLEKLARATRQFLTPSQCNATVELACETLKSLKEKYQVAQRQQDADDGDGPRKKRKTGVATLDRGDADRLALAFSLTCKVGQIVLGSLPITSVPQVQAEQLRKAVATFHAGFVEHGISRLLKTLGKASEGQETKGSKRRGTSKESTWGTQVVTVSLLRFRYSLGMANDIFSPPVTESKLWDRLLSSLSHDEGTLLPELVLEIIRALLGRGLAVNKTEASQSISYALRFINEWLPPSVAVTWSGFPHELTSSRAGRAEAGLAILQMLLERWLPVVDATASEEQLELLAKVILRIPSSQRPSSKHGEVALTTDHLLMRTLHSAQLWEFRNLRAALLSTIVASTSLDAFPSTSSPHNKSSQISQSDSFDVANVVSTYQVLLFFPTEYFSKACRTALLKRAVEADWEISKRLGAGDDDNLLTGLTVVRTFLQRTFGFLGSVEQQSVQEIANFVLHLLQDSPSSISQPECARVTLDICELYLLELFRQATRGGSAEACQILNVYLQSPVFDNFVSVKARALPTMTTLLRREFLFASFPPEAQSIFHNLHASLVGILEPRVDVALETPESGMLATVPELFTYWNALLELGRWIGLKRHILAGARLMRKINSQLLSNQNNVGWVDKVGVAVVAILMEELHFQDELDRINALEVAVAGYLSNRRLLSRTGKAELDNAVSKACRQFSPADFAHVLGVLGEMLATASPMAVHVVHLSGILLGNHPRGTLKIMQDFFTGCLDHFTSNGVLTTGPVELRVEMLEFLAEHVSERPASLRSLDLGSIWSLFSRCLAPSVTHDNATSLPVFHKIVAATSAIIRLRRDLVTPMLPHLGMVLRQLILCMRKSRPQLASKQVGLVMNTQPQWISAGQPLGIDEARALSRVLSTLTTKTITRVHATPTGTQKAESLASPFSKHAVYVLKAYLEAMNDPLCVLTVDVRRELSPGLYSLCSMIGEHSRDAMMVSALDSSGKATLKTLWREYEKQRYVGRG